MRCRLLAAAAILVAAACAKGPIHAKPGQSFAVYHGERKVLVAKNEPGPLVSTAQLDPGVPTPKHRFMSAFALYAPDEGEMRDALVAAKDFDDFLRLVKAAGFTVRPED